MQWEILNFNELVNNLHWTHLRLPADDWNTSSPVPVGVIDDGMFSAALHQPEDPISTWMSDLRKGHGNWQPAGPQAEFRKAAATLLLMETAEGDFANIGCRMTVSCSYGRSL